MPILGVKKHPNFFYISGNIIKNIKVELTIHMYILKLRLTCCSFNVTSFSSALLIYKTSIIKVFFKLLKIDFHYMTCIIPLLEAKIYMKLC